VTEDGKPTNVEAPTEGSWFADPEAILASIRAARLPDRLPSIRGYDVLHEIARGGQGVVLLAVQRSTRRRTAIKLLLDRHAAADAARRRFEREIELLASIDHPGIVRIFDSGTADDGRLYFVMEFVEGVPLDRHLALERSVGRGGVEDVATLVASIADAVHAAHQRGVIHRDLKPTNILVDAHGSPRIVDFGLARLLEPVAGAPAVSASGQFVGSLAWASPEHASGRPDAIDVRSDVYALGVVLHHALTGLFPYPVDGSLAATLQAIAERPPTKPSEHRPGIPRDLDAVVLACLAKRPDDRYQSAFDLAGDLRAVLAQAPIRARRDRAWDGMVRALRRSRRIAIASVFATIVVLVLAAVAWRSAAVAEAERSRADRRFGEARELARRLLYEYHDALLPLAGSRPARENLVATALDYLSGLETEIGDDAGFRADLAAAYERVADIQGNPTMPNLGRTEDAIASLDRSIALRKTNLDAGRDEPTSLRQLGRAMSVRGYLVGQAGRPKDAIGDIGAARALLEQALAAAPDDDAIRRELASACDKLSSQHEVLGDFAASIEVLDAAIAALDGAREPRAQRDAMNVLLYKKASGLRRAGRVEEALAVSGRSIEMQRAMIAEAPNDAMRKRSLSVDLNERSSLLVGLGRFDEAEAVLLESQTLASGLRDAEPENPTSVNDLAFVAARRAQLESARGRLEAALEAFEEAARLRARASELDPGNAVIRRGVAVAHALAADTAEKLAAETDRSPDDRRNHRARAIAAYEAALGIFVAMQKEGVLLAADEPVLGELAASIERVRSAATEPPP
jgi:tetratricopeptide (TPR) repeat protein/predicted Ser/Thr protein kinase